MIAVSGLRIAEHELEVPLHPGSDETVSHKVAEQIGSIKENITIRRFVRYETNDNGVIGRGECILSSAQNPSISSGPGKTMVSVVVNVEPPMV